MKYFIAVALMAAVASARLVVPAQLPKDHRKILGIAKPNDRVHGRPIHIGHEIVDFPLPEGALGPSPVPSPAASSSPLVQIIVNVQKQSLPVAPQEVEEPPYSVVVVDEPPSEVVVVDEAPVEPVNVGPEILN